MMPLLPSFFRTLLALSLCLTLGGCRTADKIGGAAKSAAGKLGQVWPLGDKKDEGAAAASVAGLKDTGPAKPREQVIGHVHLVHASGQFVLIKRLLRVDMRAGTELICKRGNGTPSAKLTLSPEMKDRYLVADIVNGLPAVGDHVMLYGFVDGAGNFSATPATQDGVQVLE